MATLVEFQPINLGIVVDSGHGVRRGEIHDRDGLQIDKVGDFPVVCVTPFDAVVDPHAQEMGIHVLCSNRAEDFVAAVLDQRELASIEDHANLRILEVKLFRARTAPLNLAQSTREQIAEKQGVCSVRNQELVVAKDVDLLDFVVEMRLENQAGAVAEALDNHLAGTNVREIKLALVARAAQATVKQLCGAAESPNGQPGSIGPPSKSGDGVKAFHDFCWRLFPVGSAGVEIEDTQLVVAAHNDALATGRIGGHSVLLVILGLLELLQDTALVVVEDDAAIGTRSNKMFPPRERVGSARMLGKQTCAGTGGLRVIKEEAHDGAVGVCCGDGSTINTGHTRDHHRVGRIEALRLVGLHVANAYLAVETAEDNDVGLRCRPDHASDGRRLQELVTDGLLLAPLACLFGRGRELVDEDNVVSLSDRKFGGVWGPCEGFHSEGLWSCRVCRLCCKLVLLLSGLVEEIHNTVCANSSELHVVGAPCERTDPRRPFLRADHRLHVSQLHPGTESVNRSSWKRGK
eukprot:m.643637 g.643637  ORF g.643637 m.643637 type:complete len:518 (-) comp58351_c0_seq23:743-2296(-)